MGHHHQQKFTCPMHPEIIKDASGNCPKCGTELVKQKMTAEHQKMINEGTSTKPEN